MVAWSRIGAVDMLRRVQNIERPDVRDGVTTVGKPEGSSPSASYTQITTQVNM